MWDLATELAEPTALAKRLGWEGVCALVPLEQLKEAGAGVIGVVLEGIKPGKLADAARAVRRRAVLIAVRGGDLEVNRAAVEAAEVDILLQPWGSAGERSDCGFNHVLAALAAKNRVAVAFSTAELAAAQRRQRAALFGSYLEVAQWVRKARGPFVLTSGARESWELRGPEELRALGRVLGFSEPAIRRALSGALIAENRERLSGKWVGPGVSIE